ncbi:MAG: adenylate/guanylate cyclase domain-containing protein [Saprospiraceae bacterium]
MKALMRKQVKHFVLLVNLFLLAVVGFGQSIEELEKQLKEANATKDKMYLNYQLGEAYLRSNTEKALTHAKNAHAQANELKNNNMAATSAYLMAQIYERDRNTRNMEVWLKSATQYAKAAGDADMIIKSVDKRSQLATKERNYRRAYEINQEAFSYFSQKGTSMGDLEQKFEMQKSQLEREKANLEKEKINLESSIQSLRVEMDQVDADKSKLEVKQKQLLQANEQKASEISEKEKELVNISKEKEQAERTAEKRAVEIDKLSEEAAKVELVLQEKENDLMRAELIAKESENVRNLSFVTAGGIFLVALLFYSRYRAKRKANISLEEKNKIIENERQRSDELLLNILPESIAAELKTSGKARARRFDEVTVLFTDFKNFTRISELMSPEELVEELDRCFKAFDFIIGQYPDIEKIKTIGDAYMCAAGLSDRRTLPNSLVKAALEMQEFLDEQKQERMRIGKPFFEARIGIHTGPVVAGVVGVKKFAYDIWGDTVNTASRVESNSESGRVNISETTYNLVRYKFECEYRGKVEAKNKGQIGMYFVNRELQGALVS